MKRRVKTRIGSVTVQAAFLMVMLLGMVAFAVDVGTLYVGRTSLQRTADACSMAAAWELLERRAPGADVSHSKLESLVRQEARRFARLNSESKKPLSLGRKDVELGYMSNPSNPACEFQTGGLQKPNAVRVVVQHTDERNGRLPLYFARVLGLNNSAVIGEASAALNVNFSGFQAPSDGSNLPLLPFALDLETWNSLMAGGGTDEFRYDAQSGKVKPGRDGVREFNLYPQDTGSGGNRGTVDIGNPANSVGDIARQITGGITPSDLAYVGGKLEFNSEGKLYLNGDPGISASLGKSLGKITGEARMVPVFSEVQGSGNASMFTIVKFVGIRVMESELAGGEKRVIVQPAEVITLGGIPSDDPHTEFIYSPVRLVR